MKGNCFPFILFVHLKLNLWTAVIFGNNNNTYRKWYAVRWCAGMLYLCVELVNLASYLLMAKEEKNCPFYGKWCGLFRPHWFLSAYEYINNNWLNRKWFRCTQRYRRHMHTKLLNDEISKNANTSDALAHINFWIKYKKSEKKKNKRLEKKRVLMKSIQNIQLGADIIIIRKIGYALGSGTNDG